MSSNISIKGSLSLSQTNTPTRVGERVSTELDLFNIETPYIGMIVYIADQDKYVYVKSLKSKKVGFKYVENAQVDEYAPFATGEGVKDITLSNGVLTVTYSDDSTNTIVIPGGGSNIYSSKIEDKNVAMTTKYGDYGVGTKVSALEGKSYDELFDGILFPTIDPSHGIPSLTGFVLNPNNTVVEIGTAVASISEAGLNKATWTTYNNGMAYAGDIKSIIYEFSINDYLYSNISDLSGKVFDTLGNHTYKATIHYNAGKAPKNNKGVVVEGLACPEGSVSATRTVNVTAPWFVYDQKQSLIPWNPTVGAMSTGEFTVQPHTADNPQRFKLPRKATSMQMYNTVAKQFETVSLNDWDESSDFTYTYTGSARGSVKLKVNF